MNLDLLKIIGAVTPPRGRAAFDRASLLLATHASPATYLQVTAYLGTHEVTGKPLTLDEINSLVRVEQSVLFKTSFPAVSGAVLWVLRPTFARREAALEELRGSGLLLQSDFRLSDGSFACLVREQAAALDLRDRWASEAEAEALSWAGSNHWDRAREAAERAFVLERAMSPQRIAMLALVCERQGKTQRATGYLAMARNSRGDDFLAQVEEMRQRLEAHLIARRQEEIIKRLVKRSTTRWLVTKRPTTKEPDGHTRNIARISGAAFASEIRLRGEIYKLKRHTPITSPSYAKPDPGSKKPKRVKASKAQAR